MFYVVFAGLLVGFAVILAAFVAATCDAIARGPRGKRIEERATRETNLPHPRVPSRGSEVKNPDGAEDYVAGL